MWGTKESVPDARARGARLVQVAMWLGLGLTGLGGLGGVAFWYFRDHPSFHVAAVRVYGAERVPQRELVELAKIDRGVSLFRIQLDRVRARVLKHPWIRDAVVRRLYPNEIELIVYERKPAAILESGQVYLIASDGYVLGEVNKGRRGDLPLLVAKLAHSLTPGEHVRHPGVVASLAILTQLQTSPFFRDTVITQVEIASAERLVLHTRMGKLVVGPSVAEVEEKLSLLPAIGEVIRKNAQRVAYIDLSFADRIVVKGTRAEHRAGRLRERGSGGGQTE